MLASHPQWERAPEVARRFVRYGASPRGAQALVLGAKVRALAEGRYNVSVEDLRAVALPALRHRIILNFEGEAEGDRRRRLIEQLVEAAEGAQRHREGRVPEVSADSRRRGDPRDGRVPDRVLHRLVQQVTREVRLRRAEFWALRGLFVGALAAAVPLVARESLVGWPR